MTKPAGQHSDVIIIGGGMVGLTLAHALAKRGVREITLIERGQLGREASSAAAGMLAPQAEATTQDALFEFGCAARDMYPAYAEALIAETDIEVDLDRSGTLYVALSEADASELHARAKWQTAAGLEVETLSTDDALKLEPHLSPRVLLALRFPKDIQIENRKLLAALIAANDQLGIRILTETQVVALLAQHDKITGVLTSAGEQHAGAVVLANGSWASSVKFPSDSAAGFSVEPVRGQMLCFQTKQRLMNHVTYTQNGYVVPRKDKRVIAGSTTERVGFQKRVTVGGAHSITKNALEVYPELTSMPLVDSWSGLRPCASDGLPILGVYPGISGLFVSSGHYRNGILLAPLSAELMSELIVTGTTDPRIAPFGLDRFELKKRESRA